MKELKTLLSINLCLAILLNCISPAFASQTPAEDIPAGIVSEVIEQTEDGEEDTPATDTPENPVPEYNLVANEKGYMFMRSGAYGGQIADNRWVSSYTVITADGQAATIKGATNSDGYWTTQKAASDADFDLGLYAYEVKNGYYALYKVDSTSSSHIVNNRVDGSAMVSSTISSGDASGISGDYLMDQNTLFIIARYDKTGAITGYSVIRGVDNIPVLGGTKYIEYAADTSDNTLDLVLILGAVELEVIASGTCGGEGDGSNLTWELTEDGTLTISGEGAMADNWGYPDYAPWYDYRNSIKSAVIGGSVTTIGDRAFSYCEDLVTVTIPGSVTTLGDYAFYCCFSLATVTIPDSVITIGDRAFDGCFNLASVDIGDSVTTIGDYAFSSCYVLTSVTIGDSVTTIGDGAFEHCQSLISVTLPASVNTIGDSVFLFCKSLTAIIVDENNLNYSSDSFGVLFNKDKTVLMETPGSIEEYAIPNSVTTIGKGAFEAHEALIQITIPDSVTSIGDGAFYQCAGLLSVTIPDSVTTIGDTAFGKCVNLASVTIGNSVTTIGDYAFYGSDITTVTIPDSVITIGDRACWGCDFLTSVTIPSSVIAIGEEAFQGCAALTAIIVDENNPNYSSDSFGVLFNKDKTVLVAAPGAIKNYIVPDSVTTIGTAAFQSCDSLTEVTIPASVTTFDILAFCSCDILTEIYFEGNAPTFGLSVFSGVTATAYYPAGNDTWTDEVMQDYDGTITWESYFPVIASGYCGGEEDGKNLIWELTEDGTLTISGTGAMADWSYSSNVPWYSYKSDIKTVIVKDGITSIGSYSFYNYSALTKVSIGSGIRAINYNAFSSCKNLEQVTIDQYELLVTNNGNIPETATVTYKESDPTAVIQTWAVGALDETDATATLYGDGKLVISGTGGFQKADWPSSITKVVIEDGITNVPNSAFSGCSSLEIITLGSTVIQINNFAFQETGIAEIIIPDSVDIIGSYAFSGCQKLTHVSLGKNLTQIGDCSFFGTGIAEITIPDSVSYIGKSAFSKCTSLEYLYIGRGLKSMDPTAFADCSNLSTIIWNATKLSLYANSNYNYGALGSASEVFRAAGKDSEGITLTIGPDVEYIPNYLFYVSSSKADGAVNLKHIVNQSDRLVGIGSFAFYNCTNLESVELAHSLQTIGESTFNSCSALEEITLPDTLTSIGRKAFFRTGLTEITIGSQVTAIGESAFAECSDDFVVRGFSGSYAEAYALENNFTFIPLESVLLTLYRNYGDESSRAIKVGLNAQVSLVGRGDVFLEELSTTIPGIRLVGWNTAADGTGTAYSVEDTVVMSEDLVLYAQWDIPTALIGGKEIPVSADASAETWQYVWDEDNRRATVTLTNYAGGSIVLPVDAVIYVYGETVIQSESGSALTGTRLDIAVEENANLTIRSGQDAPAIQCTYLSVWGTGTVSISSDYSVGVALTLPMEYILNGGLEIIATEKALSLDVVRVYNASDVYLAADTEEPASKYDGGAYLRIQMKTWQLELNANGGVWADQEEETKTIEVGFWEEISLANFANLLRREGFILSGWSDEDNNAEYATNGIVTSAANLLLSAMWTERTLIIDGVTYDLDAPHEGDGWSYVPADEEKLPLLTLTDYVGGRIYITSDLEIIASGDNTIKGPTGEPAIDVLGRLSLTVTEGTTQIRGGTGAHGIFAEGSIWMINHAELSIKGGSGGAAIHSSKDVSIANDGVFTAEGGALSSALYAEGVLTICEGSGKAFFISGDVEQAALRVRSASISDKLKFYGGNNASTARRRSVALQYAYVKVQPKTITVKLNINGGTLSDGIELTREYVQGEDNSITLNSNLIPTRFGYAFANWTTKRDGSGTVFVPGESYTFSDSTDELNLFAKWEELEYDIMVKDQVVLRLKDQVSADAIVFFVVYSSNGQMKDLVTGTCGDDGLWYFPNIETQADDMVKIFFLDDDAYAPLRGEIDPNA